MLQLSDELNLKLMRKIRDAAKNAADGTSSGWDEHPSEAVIDDMLDKYERPGKLEKKGFYEYDDDGKRTGLWSGLGEAFGKDEVDPSSISLADLKERMMFAEAIETVKCRDEGVIESTADANIGSIFGIGFPAWSGGVLQYIDNYVDPQNPERRGAAGFVERARELAAKYGERFEPPASLVAMADGGRKYSAERQAAATA